MYISSNSPKIGSFFFVLLSIYSFFLSNSSLHPLHSILKLEDSRYPFTLWGDIMLPHLVSVKGDLYFIVRLALPTRHYYTVLIDSLLVTAEPVTAIWICRKIVRKRLGQPVPWGRWGHNMTDSDRMKHVDSGTKWGVAETYPCVLINRCDTGPVFKLIDIEMKTVRYLILATKRVGSDWRGGGDALLAR